MIKEVLRVSAQILTNRSMYDILAKAMEEMGELSQEVAIASGGSYKQKGKDGILGEGIDVIICVLDLIRASNPKVSEEMILDTLKAKLGKWKQIEFDRMIKPLDGWEAAHAKAIARGEALKLASAATQIADAKLESQIDLSPKIKAQIEVLREATAKAKETPEKARAFLEQAGIETESSG